MTIWVLLLILVTPSGAVTSQLIPMPSGEVCSKVNNQLNDNFKKNWTGYGTFMVCLKEHDQ